MQTLNIRIPETLNNNLTSLANDLDRSKGYIVRKALEAYLQELMEDIEDYKEALEALEALKDDSPNISWEQVQGECGLLEN